MKKGWREIAITALKMLLWILGATGGTFALSEIAGGEVSGGERVEIGVEQEPLILNAPLTLESEEGVSERKGVWLVSLYWDRLPAGTFGDVYFDSQRVTVLGTPTLEKVSEVARVPLAGSKLVKVQSAIFVKYVPSEPEGGEGEPIDEKQKQTEVE